MGNLHEERTTYIYDDHDNPIETVDESDRGRQRTRFVYKYDAQGNWTEREVEWSNLTRRQITYFQ